MQADKAQKKRSKHVTYSQNLEIHHRKVAELVKKYTPTGGRVLDIGCGVGVTLNLLAQQSRDYTLYGADIDPVCLELTKELVPQSNVLQLNEDGFSPEMVDVKFDTCIMAHVLEHTYYPLDVIQRAGQVVKDGGHLILVTPNPVRPDVIRNSILRKHYVNRGHVHAWDRSHWMNFLDNIGGYNVIEYPVDEVRIFPGKLKRRIPFAQQFNINVSKLLPWWSFSNIAVIQK